MVLDGGALAKRIEKRLPRMETKLMVVLEPGNESGKKYVEKKKKLGEKLGVTVEVVEKEEILNWNKDPEVGGIMIQLPFPDSDRLISMIEPNKDVDGLRDDSPFMPATVRAVKEILSSEAGIDDYEGVVVVGNKGNVGRALMKWLPGSKGMDVNDFDPAKLTAAMGVISATGKRGLIKPEMVKEGVIAIDVGFPRGDFDPRVAEKARFFTPVPGGVGPVTVAMLFSNLADGIFRK